MTAFSFKPINQRQLDLQRRLLSAHELSESSLVAQLELQLVHRYGVTSLPKRKAESAQLTTHPPLIASGEVEPSLQDLSVISEQPIKIKQPPLTKPLSDSVEDINAAVEELPKGSNPLLAMTPPPIAQGPQRFRRWLVASSEDHYLQAS